MSSNPRIATILFTDMENSTPLWEKHPDLMPGLGSRHDALMREAIESNRGLVVKTMGDGFHAVFDSAADGAAAALVGQQAILAESWPAETGAIHVRMGLHTGESEFRDGDYYGAEVNRAARVMGIAHGGQIVLTEPTAALIRKALPPQVSLSDLGEHRLKGIAAPEQIYQLCHPSLPAEFPPLKSLSTYRHNLPVQIDTFVGREKELAEVKRQLEETHLLTMLGPGGTGKTRLMLQAAEEVIDDFRHGVWLVELAPLTDPDLIPERVAAVLNVQEQPGRRLLDVLADYLRHKELLLLLDNVEHIVRECAELVEQLLMECPNLKILVSGREALFIAGETTFQVPSLSLSEARKDMTDEQIPLETVRASEGVQLFLDRARAIHPDFDVTDENAAAIAEIVRRLDGIPLALELAAARLRMLSVEQIAARLDDRFRLLTGGRRTALPRQQTLKALIDWSWNLLEENERILLRRLSVFSGGWSLEAAQTVASDDQVDEYDVFDNLEGLINKSLVRVGRRQESEARYTMLESIRQYARDRLLESGEGEALRARHADYFVAFAQEAERQVVSSGMLLWHDRIALELDNLRSVVTWTLEEGPELALRIGGALLHNILIWLHPREARSWLEPAIAKSREMLNRDEASVAIADLIKALQSLGIVHAEQGNYYMAVRLAEESIQLAREAGESALLAFGVGTKAIFLRFSGTPELIEEIENAIEVSRKLNLDTELAILLLALSGQLMMQGDLEAVAAYFQEYVELGQDNKMLEADLFFTRAYYAKMQGNLPEAKEFYLKSIQRSEELKNRWRVVRDTSDLAHILRLEGDLEQAETYYRETILGWQELGNRPAVAHQLECFAYIAIARGEYEQAARLLGAATEAREKTDALSEEPQEIAELVQAREELAAEMGEAERDKAIAEGRLIDLDDAVLLALNENAP